MRVRRDISSIPLRTAGETWQAIVELITGPDSVDRAALQNVASVMETLIADEQPAAVPIVVKGSGPRLLIYCLYQEKAMEAGLAIDDLSWNPTGGDWAITAPGEEADVAWMNRSLQKRTPRITVHPADEPPAGDEDQEVAKAGDALDIDWGVLDKS